MNNVTLVVSSTDSYSDMWDPFFKLLKKYWDPQCPIVLSTDSRSYSYPGLNIQTMQLFKPDENPVWSKRLMRHLERIDTDYIIMILDDFFITGPVDEKKIEQCIQWMDADTQITCFNFHCAHYDTNLPCQYDGFLEKPQRSKYKMNCQAALWRRKSLLKDMREHENPWNFENLGSQRSWRYKDQKFYQADKDVIVIPYCMPGGAAAHGKWEQNAVELNEKEDLGIDFAVRGINEVVRGSRQSVLGYIFSDLSPKRIGNALVTRWKSLKP